MATWVEMLPVHNPGFRFSHMMAYDSFRAKTVLYGGFITPPLPILPGQSLRGDTWEWDGNDWTDVTPLVSPPKRGFTTIAYDESSRVTVLFGGQNNDTGGATIYYNDTWVWDGATWTQMFPATSPPPLIQASMAYDPRSGNIVLFGGLDETVPATPTMSNRTWLWDGTTWTETFPASHPSARRYSAMSTSADATSFPYVLLFGGIDLAHGVPQHDTWVWNGFTLNWAEQLVAFPVARGGLQIAPSTDCGETVMFSNALDGSSNIYDDTELWDQSGSSWTSIVYGSGPPGTINGAMAPDPTTHIFFGQGVVLYGGQIDDGTHSHSTTPTNTTWVYYCNPTGFLIPVFRNRYQVHY